MKCGEDPGLRWATLTVALTLAWSGCASAGPDLSGRVDVSSSGPSGMPQAPAAPAPVPPNASRVIASVVEVKEWPPGSLGGASPQVPAEETLFSLEIRVLSVEQVKEDLDNLATSGMEVEVFSTQELDQALEGKEIAATLELRGSTRGVRWYVREIEIKKQSSAPVSGRLDGLPVVVSGPHELRGGEQGVGDR